MQEFVAEYWWAIVLAGALLGAGGGVIFVVAASSHFIATTAANVAIGAAIGLVAGGGIGFGATKLLGGMGGEDGTDARPRTTTAEAEANLPDTITFRHLDPATLRADIISRDGTRRTETWTEQNISERIRALGLDAAQTKRRLRVDFFEVRPQLADWVVERLRSDRVEVVRAARE